MLNVYTASHNIVSPLGLTTQENFAAMTGGHPGVQQHHRAAFNEQPFWGGIIADELMQQLAATIRDAEQYTRFERMLIGSVEEAAVRTPIDLSGDETIFIVSTTKGNISLLEEQGPSAELEARISLSHSAKLLAQYFNNPNTPLVVSNACISGALAILVGKRLLQSGAYKHAVITGADTMSRFVLSGFQSFQALSVARCKPFSADRDGINLGESAATLIITTQPELADPAQRTLVQGGATSNDANHISGPSRTGEELAHAVQEALRLSGLTAADMDFVSAHGTATLFNDEMEAKAFNLSGLAQTPVNSMKGYFGHTLGASGLLESVAGIASLHAGIMIPTLGFTTLGVSQPLEVITAPEHRQMHHFIKTASGFGGCNAALVFSKPN